MNDLLVAAAFAAMVIFPCIVTVGSRVWNSDREDALDRSSRVL